MSRVDCWGQQTQFARMVGEGQSMNGKGMRRKWRKICRREWKPKLYKNATMWQGTCVV